MNIVFPPAGGAREERQPAEPRVQPGTELLVDDRPEHEDPPEAEDHARDRGEHLDERSDHAADRRRGELGQEKPDGDSDRSCEQDRERGRVDRGHDEVERAEVVGNRVPRLVPDEGDPELADRRPGTVDDLVDEKADEADRAEGGDTRDDAKGRVAEPVGRAAPRSRARGLQRRGGPPSPGSITIRPAVRRGRSPPRHQIFTSSRPCRSHAKARLETMTIGVARSRSPRAGEGRERRPSQARCRLRHRRPRVHYGNARALGGVTLDIYKNLDHGRHRPVGLRQEHLHPLPQPDERPRPGRQGRRAASSTTARTSTAPTSTPSRCAAGSGWSSSGRTRSRSRSTTTSPSPRRCSA